MWYHVKQIHSKFFTQNNANNKLSFQFDHNGNKKKQVWRNTTKHSGPCDANGCQKRAFDA